MRSFAEIIDAWGTRGALARDVGAPAGRVAVWRYRDRIPATYWLKLVAAAAERGIEGVSLETLAALSEEPPAASASETTRPARSQDDAAS